MVVFSLLLTRYFIIFRLVGSLIGGLLGCPSPQQIDLKVFDSGDYDCAFVSMYTTEGFLESEYEMYRGFQIYKNQFEIKDETVFRNYLDHILTSDKELKCLYLGVLPESVGADVIEDYARSYPEMVFEVLPAYYDISNWQALDPKTREKRMKAYRELSRKSLCYDNVRVYNYFGTEWLIANRMNYQEGLLLDPGVASTVMLTADYLQSYVITQDNLDTTFQGLQKLISEWDPDSYPDLSDWNLVFLGDSVFGNYRDGSSIPHVIEGLTGAKTYNLAIGATVAVPLASCEYHLGKMVDLLEKREYCEIPDGVTYPMKKTLDAVNRDMQLFYEEKEGGPTVFFLHYGFNEYIANIPVEDTDGQNGFFSSLKTQILRLKKLYPDAKIVVLIPNRITVFENGTRITGENPCILADYGEAILKLADLDGVTVISNYDLFLNEQREIMTDCLDDGLHPSVKGRYLLGRNIAGQLSKLQKK
ncbi:MAG: SGNH/GDSL hydrolase family protein [Acetatifactor sp.]